MFKVIDEVCTPQRGTKYSAYVDLFARESVSVGAGETNIIPLGIKIDSNFFIYEIGEIDVDAGGRILSFGKSEKVDKFLKSHYLEVALRSSLAVKGLIIPNGIGIIDLDYLDEIGLIVHYPYSETIYKVNDKRFKIKKGDKVAQCTLKEHKGYLMGYESDVVRNGGYGSTDKGF